MDDENAGNFEALFDATEHALRTDSFSELFLCEFLASAQVFDTFSEFVRQMRCLLLDKICE